MIKLRKYMYLSAMILLFTVLFPCLHLRAEGEGVKPAAGDKQEHPRISLDAARFDAGEVDEGDVIIHGFTVKNTGTATLNIEKVKAG